MGGLFHQVRQPEPSCDGSLGAENSGVGGKKKHYESVFRREQDGLDDEFPTLKFMSQEP